VIIVAELTVRGFIHMDDKIVPLEDLSLEQLADAKEHMLKNLSRGISEYFSEHTDEFVKLSNCAKRDSAV
jgi:hypothetical protein